MEKSSQLGRVYGAYLDRYAAQFDEGKHPRDEGGKFTSKAGGGEKRRRTVKKGQIVRRKRDGAHREVLRIFRRKDGSIAIDITKPGGHPLRDGYDTWDFRTFWKTHDVD